MNRPSWNEYFKEIVNVTSKRSSCDRLQHFFAEKQKIFLGFKEISEKRGIYDNH